MKGEYLFNKYLKYLKEWVLKQKKGDLEMTQAKNTKIWYKNMKPLPQHSFCCFCFSDKLPI